MRFAFRLKDISPSTDLMWYKIEKESVYGKKSGLKRPCSFCLNTSAGIRAGQYDNIIAIS